MTFHRNSIRKGPVGEDGAFYATTRIVYDRMGWGRPSDLYKVQTERNGSEAGANLMATIAQEACRGEGRETLNN
jgi:hypothetical protein